MLIVKDVMAIQLKCTKMLHANSKQFNLDLMDLKKGTPGTTQSVTIIYQEAQF